MSTSVLRRNVFAIDLEDGASPDVAEDNVFEENENNGVTFGQKLQPAPMPEIPPP